MFTAKICTHPPINTSSATEEQDDDNAIKPLEESSSGSSQGSSREAVLSTCPQQWQNELGSSSVNKVDYKPHTGFKDPKDFPEHDEEQDSEAPLPPGIPEVSKQQYAKSSYADIPLRRSHQERSSRRCCAQQNRLSCPEFLLKIPKNTVTGQYPLMPNANIFHSSYGQKDYSHEEQFRSGVTEEAIADVCRQITTNPHCQETAGLCLSEEEEGAHHKEVSWHHVISLLVCMVHDILHFELGGSSCYYSCYCSLVLVLWLATHNAQREMSRESYS